MLQTKSRPSLIGGPHPGLHPDTGTQDCPSYCQLLYAHESIPRDPADELLLALGAAELARHVDAQQRSAHVPAGAETGEMKVGAGIQGGWGGFRGWLGQWS